MAIKDSIVNLKKGLRTTLTNVPALIDTLEKGFSEISEEISTSADVKKATDNFSTINGGLLSECKVKLSPVQSGSGTPSPTNVRPITGHTQVEINITDGQITQAQINVNLGGTYYSGTINIVTGKFIVDKVKATSPTRGNLDSSGKLYNITFSGGIIHNHNNGEIVTPYIMCSHFDVDSLSGARETLRKCICQYAGDIYIGGYTDDPDILDSILADSNFSIVFELATPQIIQLSPTMVKALVGYNKLTTPLDGQEIEELEYKEIFTYSDVEIAIDNAIASVYPETPATDGTYVLTIVKTGTTITRSWESTTTTNTSKKK